MRVEISPVDLHTRALHSVIVWHVVAVAPEQRHCLPPRIVNLPEGNTPSSPSFTHLMIPLLTVVCWNYTTVCSVSHQNRPRRICADLNDDTYTSCDASLLMQTPDLDATAYFSQASQNREREGVLNNLVQTGYHTTKPNR